MLIAALSTYEAGQTQEAAVTIQKDDTPTTEIQPAKL